MRPTASVRPRTAGPAEPPSVLTLLSGLGLSAAGLAGGPGASLSVYRHTCQWQEGSRGPARPPGRSAGPRLLLSN